MPPPRQKHPRSARVERHSFDSVTDPVMKPVSVVPGLGPKLTGTQVHGVDSPVPCDNDAGVVVNVHFKDGRVRVRKSAVAHVPRRRHGRDEAHQIWIQAVAQCAHSIDSPHAAPSRFPLELPVYSDHMNLGLNRRLDRVQWRDD